MMPHHGTRRIHAPPPRDARAQPEFRVVAIREEVLVESADLVQHRLPIHRRAAVRPEHLLLAIELALIQYARPAAAILSVRKNQVSYLVDAPRILPHQHLTRGHPDIRL